MKPSDFVASDQWKRHREEIRLEIMAVILPVLIYSAAVSIGHFGLSQIVGANAKLTQLQDLLKIPDALFGACILFAFSLIQGFGIESDGREADVAAWAAIRRWRERAVAGFTISILGAGASVIFKPQWALLLGLIFLYCAALAYKKVCFHRAYIRILTSRGT